MISVTLIPNVNNFLTVSSQTVLVVCTLPTYISILPLLQEVDIYTVKEEDLAFSAPFHLQVKRDEASG